METILIKRGLSVYVLFNAHVSNSYDFLVTAIAVTRGKALTRARYDPTLSVQR